MQLTERQLWALPSVRRTRDAFRAAEQRYQLRPLQRRIEWGGYAVRFVPMDTSDYVTSMGEASKIEDRVVLAEPSDLDALQLIFVDIPSLGEFTDREQALGATQEEALRTRDQATRAWARGWRYGWHYSEQEPDGEPGMTHGSMLWPITQQAFEWARYDWDWRSNVELERVVHTMIDNEVPVRVPILDRSFVTVELAADRTVLQLDCDIIRGAP